MNPSLQIAILAADIELAAALKDAKMAESIAREAYHAAADHLEACNADPAVPDVMVRLAVDARIRANGQLNRAIGDLVAIEKAFTAVRALRDRK